MNVFQVNGTTIDTARKVLSVVDQGLCLGLGKPIPGQMCVEAAVCYALGMPYEVDPALRLFGMMLNGSSWSSPKARAKGMRKLAVAQLGSLGQIDSIKFAQKLAEQTIRQILPPLLRQIRLNDVANRCEQEGTVEAAGDAAYAARDADAYAARYTVEAAHAAHSAAYAARKAAARYAEDDDANVFLATHSAAYTAYAARSAADATPAYATYAARSAAYASYAACDGVLLHMIDICIDILRDMEAPGIALMDQVC